MKKNINLKGSLVAIVTPFLDDGEIDMASYEKLLEWHLESGTNGIVVCGTTGETPTLSESEYEEMVRFTVKKIDGKIPIIAGSGSNSTQKTVKTSKLAESLGADGILVVGPYYNKPTDQGLYLHFSEVARSVKIPIIVYNVPGRTGKNISAPVLLKLAREFENIVAVKEASGNFSQIMEILRDRKEGFSVLSGDDAFALPMVSLGAEGCISVVANQIPKEFTQMLKSAREGDMENARKIHYKYLSLMDLNFIESNPMPVKTALSAMGLIGENFRLPMCKMEEKNKTVLLEELNALGLI